jgi:hypothetical protein
MSRHRTLKPKPGQLSVLLPASLPRRNLLALAVRMKHAGAHGKPWKALRRQQRQQLAASGRHDD